MPQSKSFLKFGLILGLIAAGVLSLRVAEAGLPSIAGGKQLFGKGEKHTGGGKQPMIVNGDTVEFKSEGREVVAEGHVEIVHEDSTLVCDRVRVFIDEKLALAEGHVKLSKKDGPVLEGDAIVYDFAAQSGTIVSPRILMAPYYGKAELMEKISETEFLVNDCDLSTCDLPHPHYTLHCKEVKMNPGNSMTAKGVKFSILDVPLMYMPVFSQQLMDKRPKFMILPGNKRDFGMELFGSYRYYLSQNVKGLLHLDWYQKKGWAEGVDLNYNSKIFGLGNIKYYTIDQEGSVENVTRRLDETGERYRAEVRHKWDLSDRDHVILEYFKESDIDFRKDYFLREYQKNTNPQSFFLWSHVFPNATLSFLGQPRVNDFDAVLQRIPELKLETVNQKMGDTSFYFKNTTAMAHLVNAPADMAPAPDVSRIDSTNQVGYVCRFMSIDMNPYVGYRGTYYDRELLVHDDVIRSTYFGGVDMSTKLFKIYDVGTNAMNLDINKLRHIVTPSIRYLYQEQPTVSLSRLFQLDDVDALDRQNVVTLGLENKLQTKRKGEPVDLLTFILSSDYDIERNTTTGKGFQNVKYKLELKPYSSWELDSEAEYDTINKNFRTLTTDYWQNIAKDTHLGLGYRYKQGESSQVTAGFNSPLNPFWSIGVYERFELRTGKLVEQEYTLDRDLHCWTMQFIINQHEGNGIAFMLGFKLKAFPEIGLHAKESFNPPRTP